MSTDDLDDTTVTSTDEGTTRERPGLRPGTVVWGLVIALVGVGVLLVGAGYTIDVQLASIVLLIAAGLGLILGPLIQSLRRGRTADR